MPGQLWVAKSDNFWWSGNTKGPAFTGPGGGGGAPSAPNANNTLLVLNEQFTGSSLSSIWHPYQDSVDGHFGGSTRIQTYQYSNIVVGAGSAGSTGGTSCKLIVNETDNGAGFTMPSGSSAGTRYTYTAGMFDSRSASVWYPRYGYYRMRCKVPHAQGLWSAPFWFVAKNGGSGTCEFDLVEYFHSQVPGRMSFTLHALDNSGTNYVTNKYTNNGSAQNGGGPTRYPFEDPTYTPGWHTWDVEIVPVTSSAGTTLDDPTQPSSFVRYTVYVDGVQAWRVVDPTALWYTTNGGTEDQFWNIFSQGCQVDGNNVGHPRDTLGYSHWTNACLISGTPPNSCAVTASDGNSVQRALFNGVANVTEIDYMQIWKYTG